MINHDTRSFCGRITVQVARERVNGPLAKREQEVHTMGEPETAQNPEYSTMELKTPVASGMKRGDPEDAMQAHWSHSGDTESLYNSNWASKNKVEQLKLQVMKHLCNLVDCGYLHCP